tara:strand:- start:369 stop:1130 length:762 start_codon:yes stop_codon:yes gene_type:complete
MYIPTAKVLKEYADAKRRGAQIWWRKRKARALENGEVLDKAQEFALAGYPNSYLEPRRRKVKVPLPSEPKRKVKVPLPSEPMRKVKMPAYFEPTRKTKTDKLLMAYFETLLKNGDKYEKRIPAPQLKSYFEMLNDDQLGRLPQKGYVPVTRIPKANTNSYKRATDKTFSKLADDLRYVGFITELRRELARLRRGQGRAAPKKRKPAATKSPVRFPLALYNKERANYISRQMPKKRKPAAKKSPVGYIPMADEI